MLRERIQASNYSFLDKLRSIDYLLILLIIAIGSISVFAIYSTEGGEFSFYTKNHIIRSVSYKHMTLPKNREV